MNLYEEITLAEGQVIIHEILDPPPTNPSIFVAFGPSKKAIEEAWGEKFRNAYEVGSNTVPLFPNDQTYNPNHPPIATLLEIHPGVSFDTVMSVMTMLAAEMLIFSSKAPSAFEFIERLVAWVKDPTNDDPFGTMK